MQRAQPAASRSKRGKGERRMWLLAGLLVCALPCLAPACASEDEEEPGRERELVVFAAASLRDAFEALGARFRRAHDDVEITFNFAGSQKLRTQIEHGAAADVFASANREHMASLARQDLIRPDVLVARNELVVVVPRGAARVKSFADLPAAERLVIGGPAVPVGRYTRQVLGKAEARWPGFRQRVLARVASQELSVRQVLAKVVLGEADAGIVYRTDAAVAAGAGAAGGEVAVVPIPADLNVVATYPIAVLAKAPHPALAAAWVEHVRAPAGQQVLARFGFALPAPGDAPRERR